MKKIYKWVVLYYNMVFVICYLLFVIDTILTHAWS